jgi:uncharacterized protein (DUF2384 family)
MAVIPSSLFPQPDPASVLTKAVMRAAEALGLSGKVLSAMLGVSEASLSRMKRGDFKLEASSKSFELGVLFVRLFRSLDAIVGGEAAIARAWLNNPNSVLDRRPVEAIQTVTGLIDVIAYLDSRRALI